MDLDTGAATRALSALKALSDANRLRIVELIAAKKNICALEILEELNITQPTLSHHMKTLVESGLVESSKEGRWRKYSLRSANVRSFLKDLAALLGN